MESAVDQTYQEGGIRYPDAVAVDLEKGSAAEMPEITKLTGWWSDEGVLGLEVEHGGISVKGVCERLSHDKPPHCASLRMSDHEYLTAIEGQLTSKIERLTFRTSRGTAITFGEDKAQGTLFKLCQKNYRVAAIRLGVAKYFYFIGAYFGPLPTVSPSVELSPTSVTDTKEIVKESKRFPEYMKAIEYEPRKALPMVERKALEDPKTYGKFNDFQWAIQNSVEQNKRLHINEVMLFYSMVKRQVLGYRLKYEICDKGKQSGKIVELRHVAPNPLTPTLHVIQSLDENEYVTQLAGRRNRATEAISYLAFITTAGKRIEIGAKQGNEGEEEFVLDSGKGKKIIAFAGKVTDALNEIAIYSTNQ